MKDFMNVDSEEYAGFKLSDYIECVAENCNVKYDLVYAGVSFNFPSNTYHYQLFIDGGQEDIDLFKRAVKDLNS
jgi:hypothetical protein